MCLLILRSLAEMPGYRKLIRPPAIFSDIPHRRSGMGPRGITGPVMSTRSVLYTQDRNGASDLMLVENFR
ncbi:MAG TPA: hypothetical protein VH601_04225 [Bryobacteraceae bacterium]|jgi:hypothetical protein